MRWSVSWPPGRPAWAESWRNAWVGPRWMPTRRLNGGRERPSRIFFGMRAKRPSASLEGEVIQDLCNGSGRVIAAGGGAFVETENRQHMLSGCRVICLAARPETILQRLAQARQSSNPNTGGDNDDRPMLGGEDVLRRVTELLALKGWSLRPGPLHVGHRWPDAGTGG